MSFRVWFFQAFATIWEASWWSPTRQPAWWLFVQASLHLLVDSILWFLISLIDWWPCLLYYSFSMSVNDFVIIIKYHCGGLSCCHSSFFIIFNRRIIYYLSYSRVWLLLTSLQSEGIIKLTHGLLIIFLVLKGEEYLLCFVH